MGFAIVATYREFAVHLDSCWTQAQSLFLLPAGRQLQSQGHDPSVKKNMARLTRIASEKDTGGERMPERSQRQIRIAATGCEIFLGKGLAASKELQRNEDLFGVGDEVDNGDDSQSRIRIVDQQAIGYNSSDQREWS